MGIQPGLFESWSFFRKHRNLFLVMQWHHRRKRRRAAADITLWGGGGHPTSVVWKMVLSSQTPKPVRGRLRKTASGTSRIALAKALAQMKQRIQAAFEASGDNIKMD